MLAELNRLSGWAAWRRIRARLGSPTWRHARHYTPSALAALLRRAGAKRVQARAAAYLPPEAPHGLLARAAAYEPRMSRLGSVGGAFSLARGDLRRG